VARRVLHPPAWRAWADITRVRASAWIRARGADSRHPVLDEEALRRTRRSDTAFIFGSGASLNEITTEQWACIAAHDVISFSYFPRGHFVRIDYHLVGEIATHDDRDRSRWVPAIGEYVGFLNDNPGGQDTIVGLQEGWMAYQSNRVLASGLLRPGTRIFRYRRIARGRMRPPSRSLAEGIVHGAATLVGCVNLAYILGHRDIVIAGVDLYDSRYFWLPPDKPRPDMIALHGVRPDERHPLAATVVPYLGQWREMLARDSVRLWVLNPRSLLAEVLPVYHLAGADERK
jgi:hypothetical protein